MGPVRETSARWTIRLLAAGCVLLAVMCLALAVAWNDKAQESTCLRAALADGTTPAVADLDCGRAPRR